MINKRIFEGKDKEDLLNKIKEELHSALDDLYIEEEVISGGLFKGQKYILKVITKEDVKNFIENYVNEYAKLSNIKIQFALTEEEDFFNLILVSDCNPILIGRDGKTLEYFQFLLRQSLLKNTGHTIHINVDVAGYKEKKMKNLERQIKEIAKEVVNSKIDVSLDPMNSYERRKVHSIISSMEHLKTESVGEGKERHIVIKYIEE